MNRALVVTGLSLSLVMTVPAAAGVAPDVLVKETTDKVLSRFTADRAILTDDHAKLYALVDELVLPHFDFERMSALVLGRYWSQATEAQQQRFVEEFRTLLVRTYATALFEYTGQPINYKQLQMNDEANGHTYEPESHWVYFVEKDGAVYSFKDEKPLEAMSTPGSG